MIHIIVAFPKKDTAQSIKRILVQSGCRVESVCITGAQVLQAIDGLDEGIVVCGYRFADMVYEELYGYLPNYFDMLLIASPANCKNREISDIVCLFTPLKANELIATIRMMENALIRRKKKKSGHAVRSDEEKAMVSQAKNLLMGRNNLSEEEAHRYIQKRSMDNGTSLVETAQMILSLFS